MTVWCQFRDLNPGRAFEKFGHDNRRLSASVIAPGTQAFKTAAVRERQTGHTSHRWQVS